MTNTLTKVDFCKDLLSFLALACEITESTTGTIRDHY